MLAACTVDLIMAFWFRDSQGGSVLSVTVWAALDDDGVMLCCIHSRAKLSRSVFSSDWMCESS